MFHFEIELFGAQMRNLYGNCPPCSLSIPVNVLKESRGVDDWQYRLATSRCWTADVATKGVLRPLHCSHDALPIVAIEAHPA